MNRVADRFLDEESHYPHNDETGSSPGGPPGAERAKAPLSFVQHPLLFPLLLSPYARQPPLLTCRAPSPISVSSPFAVPPRNLRNSLIAPTIPSRP